MSSYLDDLVTFMLDIILVHQPVFEVCISFFSRALGPPLERLYICDHNTVGHRVRRALELCVKPSRAEAVSEPKMVYGCRYIIAFVADSGVAGGNSSVQWDFGGIAI